jgi:hypothetical protein
MWWKLVLQAAVAVGLDKWAKRKAINLAAKIKSKATKKADMILETVGQKALSASSIIVREDRDMLRPGQVVVKDDRSYRVTKLLLVNKLGAFYEAKAE